MHIQNNYNLNFRGYDARHLQGFFIGAKCNGIINDMQYIGRKEGFRVFSNHGYGKSSFCSEAIPEWISHEDNYFSWAQDVWTFLKNKLITSQSLSKVEIYLLLKMVIMKICL